MTTCPTNPEDYEFKELPSRATCVGPGWTPIVQMLEQIAEKNGYHISQVKEKWGKLRVYASAPPWFCWFVDECEAASANICEVCGKEGEIRSKHGWLMARCDSCWEEEKA